MDADGFLISEFRGVMKVHDPLGRYLVMNNRHCAVIIITLSGEIRFTQNGRTYISDSNRPVFIPKGACYVNECTKDAHSLMFSFQTVQGYCGIEHLYALSAAEYTWYYDMIKNAQITKKSGYRQRQLQLMYSMLEKMLCTPNKKESLAERAAAIIRERCADPSFNCKALASVLYVSEAYLRRSFKSEYFIGIGEYLKKIRMEKAREMLLEMRCVTETARDCGYSDVYQFSRAYKNYYGYSPTKTAKMRGKV